MNAVLDKPPVGFEEVTIKHFRLVGPSALRAAELAAEEESKNSATAPLAAQLRVELEGLRKRLAKLPAV